MFNHHAIPKHTSVILVCSAIMVIFANSGYKIPRCSIIELPCDMDHVSSRISKTKSLEFSILPAFNNAMTQNDKKTEIFTLFLDELPDFSPNDTVDWLKIPSGILLNGIYPGNNTYRT